MKNKVKKLIPEWLLRMESYYVIATDLEGRYTFVNDHFKTRFAYMGISFVDQPFSITIHPNDVERAKQAAYQCINEPGKTVSVELRKPRMGQEEYIWTQWEFSLLKDKDGEPIGIICLGHDITKSKKAIKENKEFVSLFRDIGQNVPGMIYQFRMLTDGSVSFPYISGNSFKYFSLKPEDLRENAESVFDLIHPDDLQKVHESIHQSSKKISSWRCTFRVVLPENRTIWLEGKSIPERLADGSLVWNGFLNDVTEREEYLAQLEVNEQRLRSLLELQTCYVLRLDMQGNYIYANQKYLSTFGHLYRNKNNSCEYLGVNSIDAIHPEDVSIAEAAMENLAKSPDRVYQADLRKPLENGEFAHTLWDFSFIFDSDGQPVEIQCVGIDYTERKKKEEELRRSEYKLNAILNSTQEGNILFRPDYRIISYNKAAEKNTQMVFGKSLHEHDSMLDFVLPETKEVFMYDTQQALNGEYVEREFNVKGHWFEFNFFPVYDEKKELIGVAMNSVLINDRKRDEEALLKAKEEAERASKAKSQFLANMSHELRTPLNGVIGFTEILSETSLTPVQQQYVKNANVSGHNLLKIINDVLSLSKIEAGMLELDFVRTDIIELIENSINVVEVAAARKDLELILSIDPELPRFAVTDSLRLTQILTNLLSNAVKFTEKGKVELCVDYHSVRDDKGSILFSVRDTGVGITEEQRQKLFKAFLQADSSTTRRFGGTGLGLVISQMIAEKMDSHIEFESTSGKGSRFYFEILVETEKDQPVKETLSNKLPDKTGKASKQHQTILVAEDVSLNMRLIITLLGFIRPKATLLKAEDGKKAVELYRSGNPDLVIMDVQMPKMDGLDATRAIRELERETGIHIPIVALTASAMKEEREKCIAAGMDDVLTKPIEVDKLKFLIENL